MRICLSCNSREGALAQTLEAGNRDAKVSFAPKSLRVGNFFVPQLCASPDEAVAFLLLLGKSAIRWWLRKALETFGCHVTDDGFPQEPVTIADKAQRRINFRKSARGLKIAPNSDLIRKARLSAHHSENDPLIRGNKQSAQSLHRHTTPKTHGRTAWHI